MQMQSSLLLLLLNSYELMLASTSTSSTGVQDLSCIQSFMWSKFSAAAYDNALALFATIRPT